MMITRMTNAASRRSSDRRTSSQGSLLMLLSFTTAVCLALFVTPCHAQPANQVSSGAEAGYPQLIRTPPMRVNPNTNSSTQSFSGNGSLGQPQASSTQATPPNGTQFPEPTPMPSSFGQPNQQTGVQPAVAWGQSNEMSVSPASAASAISSTNTTTRKPIELLAPSKGVPSPTEKPQGSWGAIISMVFSLLIVLCVFLGLAWMVRKTQPSAFVKLPSDVVQVMGRTPMAPRQQMYVVRFGNKMLLVSHQPGQTQTLCEITDEDEVQRLAGLCEANQPSSITSSFKEVFRQVASGKQQAAPKLRASVRG